MTRRLSSREFTFASMLVRKVGCMGAGISLGWMLVM